ncbi:MAG: hypothetical protein AB7P49_17580, partial [Bdellovibrionales bacterium]
MGDKNLYRRRSILRSGRFGARGFVYTGVLAAFWLQFVLVMKEIRSLGAIVMRNLGIVLALYFVSNMAATNAFAVNLCEEAEGSFRREYTFTFSDAKGNGFKPYFSKRAQCEEAAERMRKEEVRTKFCGCASAFAKTQTVIVSVAALRSLSTNKEMLYCYEVDQDGVVTKYHVNTW